MFFFCEYGAPRVLPMCLRRQRQMFLRARVLLILESLPLSSYVKHHLFAKFAAVARATATVPFTVALAQGALGLSLYTSQKKNEKAIDATSNGD